MSAPTIRRLVTGHNGEGLAVVVRDETREGPGPTSTLIWTTDKSPADNVEEADGGDRKVGVTLAGGTVFRMTRFEPGHRSPMHRSSSVDYAIVMEGEVVLELDSGEQVKVDTGEVVVQRGTNHTWVNTSDRPCLVAFILIDAEPVKVGDRVLEPTLVSFRPS